ncbi:hypothetical protein TREMEDRAFT_62847 [Tremella mesenterica DSM 1558]|uniref:uncharacterized protein n=1 Tax=Tremella mesenterica (strain ATCC 24925 / CBS 8224 / DSM 1558 / NBRC 9311 / NRRL Y-6157 / RJB 2259-6 / UBC 559-6) TaxID=578456 RepID=UPI0003F4A20B|nr:uncharacterized protein TREMEDRAFT_62847 [Tremella mesenterica DSM 1558]EIW69121.1 hypothetical protein TREMEDRAFT_62847 [Tremella mesenterica DSM 1558]
MPPKRRNKTRQTYDDGEEVIGGQVLPIAEIAEDWVGVPEDGATYLALAGRANAGLSFFSRAPLPREIDVNVETEIHIEASHVGTSKKTRHPALPKESWLVTFAEHFKKYRQNLTSRWPPPSMTQPPHYPPFPDIRLRSSFDFYLHGPSRAKRKGSRARKRAAVRAAAISLEEEESMMNDGVPISDVTAEVRTSDQISGMSTGGSGEKNEEEEDGGFDEDLEEEYEVIDEGTEESQTISQEEEGEDKPYEPPEPLLSVLKGLHTNNILRLLTYFTHFLLDPLSSPILSIPSYLPTQPPSPPTQPQTILPEQPHTTLPDNTSTSHTPNSTHYPAKKTGTLSKPRREPFPDLYARWIFTLLLILDNQLSGEEISILRELARAAMKVAGWRWIVAVNTGEITKLVSVSPTFHPSTDGSEGGKNGVIVGDTYQEGEISDEEEDEGWELGVKWKKTREKGLKHKEMNGHSDIDMNGGTDSDEQNGGRKDEVIKEDSSKKREGGNVDDTLSRCWLIVAAISVGWAQHDLLQEMESLFS